MHSPPPQRLYLLAGPTASGKTDLAHLLAERHGLRLLSVDSMMVYRRMDIGTAKPTPSDILRFDYAGLDLAEADQPFSTGAWLRAVRTQLDPRPTLAVGGTGLYFRALLEGLAEETQELPAVDDSLPVAELQARIRAIDPDLLGRLSDPRNPRRLARTLSWLLAGLSPPTAWQTTPPLPLPVLRRPTTELNDRILLRARLMFENGLPEEAQTLRHQFGDRLATASQAIGYREAFDLLDGHLSLSAAIERTATRTRQYAKRQRTWFRNQHHPLWIDLDHSSNLHEVAHRIELAWGLS